MLSWLFKRGIDKKFNEVNHSIKNSFFNIKEDLGNVTNWINHFKDKHEAHEETISNHSEELNLLKEKVEKLESLITENFVFDEEKLIEENEKNEEKEFLKIEKEEPSLPKIEIKFQLPPAQSKVCWILARLQQENPEKWVSLKELASEVYPDKDYTKSRSAISQLVNILEAEGYIIKKRVRKSIYVYLKKDKAKLFLDKISSVKVKEKKKKAKKKE